MPARAPIVLLLVAVLVGGCASGKVREANDYVNAVNKAQSDYIATSQQLLGHLRPGETSAGEAAKLRRFYAAVDGFVSQLEAIKPPARVRGLHARLIASMQDFGRSLRTAGAAMVSHNALRILDGQQKLATATSSASHELNRTMQRINAALHSSTS